MARVSMWQELQASAENVWELMGVVDSVPTWHPAVVKSSTVGQGEVRRPPR